MRIILANEIRKENKIKIKKEKGRDQIVSFKENQTRDFRVDGYKVKKKNQYSNINKLKNTILKYGPFTIATESIKCQGSNLINYTQNF